MNSDTENMNPAAAGVPAAAAGSGREPACRLPLEEQAYAAFARAQGEFRTACADGRAAYGRYASLASVIAACRGALNRQGICLFMPVTTSGDSVSAIVRLVYRGFAIESGPFTVPVAVPPASMNRVQAVGSAASYARRYALSSFLCITVGEDDDGSGAGGARQADPAGRYSRRLPQPAAGRGRQEGFPAALDDGGPAAGVIPQAGSAGGSSRDFHAASCARARSCPAPCHAGPGSSERDSGTRPGAGESLPVPAGREEP